MIIKKKTIIAPMPLLVLSICIAITTITDTSIDTTGSVNIMENTFTHTEDINDPLRFTIQNLNNGTKATTVISAFNDVNGSMSIGIGSSNFILGNESLPSITALFSRSQGDMIFADLFNNSFKWFCNPKDDNNASNLVEIMELGINGLSIQNDVRVTGNLNIGNFLQYNSSEGTLAIGTFNDYRPFQNTTSLDRGIHLRSENSAIVWDELNTTDNSSISRMSAQAGRSFKFAIKDEINNKELYKIMNDGSHIFNSNDNTSSIALIGNNNLQESSMLGFYEGFYQNNGIEIQYDSLDNELQFMDWTGGIIDTTPRLTIDRNTDSICVNCDSPLSNLHIVGEVRITDTITGSNAGTALCIDINNELCKCGSCA